ncbi:MAG: hypothetical protein WD534_15300 [Phycisphaeraceae bacterium]
MKEDENVQFEDIPPRQTLKVLTPMADKRRGRINWALAERLGRVRLWGTTINNLPVGPGGDDFYPPAINPLEDKYSGP